MTYALAAYLLAAIVTAALVWRDMRGAHHIGAGARLRTSLVLGVIWPVTALVALLRWSHRL